MLSYTAYNGVGQNESYERNNLTTRRAATVSASDLDSSSWTARCRGCCRFAISKLPNYDPVLLEQLPCTCGRRFQQYYGDITTEVLETSNRPYGDYPERRMRKSSSDDQPQTYHTPSSYNDYNTTFHTQSPQARPEPYLELVKNDSTSSTETALSTSTLPDLQHECRPGYDSTSSPIKASPAQPVPPIRTTRPRKLSSSHKDSSTRISKKGHCMVAFQLHTTLPEDIMKFRKMWDETVAL